MLNTIQCSLLLRKFDKKIEKALGQVSEEDVLEFKKYFLLDYSQMLKVYGNDITEEAIKFSLACRSIAEQSPNCIDKLGKYLLLSSTEKDFKYLLANRILTVYIQNSTNLEKAS